MTSSEMFDADQQKEIARQEEIIQRFMNTRDVAKVIQAQSRQKLLDQMKRVDNPLEAKHTKITFEPEIKSGQDVLFAEKQINNKFHKFIKIMKGGICLLIISIIKIYYQSLYLPLQIIQSL